MRHDLMLLGVLAATLGGAHVSAQTPDSEPLGASQAEQPAVPGKPKAKPKVPAKPVSAKPAVTKPAVVKPVSPKPPPVPVVAPPPPVLPPPIAVPTRPMPPPIPAAVTTDAGGAATPQKDGLRITFGPGSSDLNPSTDAAIRSLVHAAPPFATTTFSITAMAPGTEEEPSTPRRLSLSRALAVRSVLITEGIASSRIYVKAMGANPQALAGGPADRADILVGGTVPAAQQGQARTP